MLISPKNKFMFFKPMKTAGSSIECALFQASGPDALCTGSRKSPMGINKGEGWEYNQQNNISPTGEILFHSHVTPEWFWNKIKHKELFRDYKLCSMTRNPWETCVSFFWFSMRENVPEQYARASFNNWLTYINPKGIYSYKNLVKEQKSSIQYISEINEACISDNIDCYIRFEHLESDYKIAAHQLNVPVFQLKKFKGNYKQINKHYSWFYSDQSIKLVEEYFPKTINKFKYKFERREQL